MLITAFILLLTAWLAAEFLSPFLIIIPPPGHRYDIPDFDQGYFQEFELETFDQLQLSAAFRPSDLPDTKSVVIFVHGIGGKKEHFMGMADWLATQGFAAVVFDGRAHGQSGGRYCTYGYKEKQDIQVIVRWIEKKLPGTKIGIWGNSLGGAIAIQALAIEPHLSFGIVQSTFADLEQIVFDYQNRIMQGFGSRSLSDRALRRAGRIADFDPASVRPAQTAARLQLPILLIHGEQDENISVDYAQQIYQALPTTNKQFIRVPEADHFDVFDKGGAKLHDQLIDFLVQQ
ncbi:MAG: alpha/beta hydrolase [Saprospiraceae bacterium]|nr:alpha/beta hydrolase [Saprospiraceae bacterium]